MQKILSKILASQDQQYVKESHTEKKEESMIVHDF